MFDTTHFDLNETLFEESRKLIAEHNGISYTDVSLEMPSVVYTYISKKVPTDASSTELISFYELFTHQRITAYNIKRIIDSIDYSHEDLTLNIDRSDSGILQLMTSLTGIRLRLIDFHESIMANIDRQVDSFADYINTTTVSNLSVFIDAVFTCMTQDGLDKHVDIEPNSRYFLPVGARLIELLYAQIQASNLMDVVHAKTDMVKQSVLSVKQDMHAQFDVVNRLQTFNLYPGDGQNVDLKTALSMLFGIDVEVRNLSEDRQVVETALAQLSLDKNKQVGLLVITSINDDTFFDMSTLASMPPINDAQGITTDLIGRTHLIKSGAKAVVKKSELLSIHTTAATEEAFVLWSNDMKMFKLRQAPISNGIIQKLLRRAPSPIIESYNDTLMRILNATKTHDDAIAFKRVQYMAFNETTTEDSFIEGLKARIEAFVGTKTKLSEDKFKEWVITDAFDEELLSGIDSAKSELGIDRTLMSPHCHIIYNSMAARILNRLKRRLLAADDITKSAVSGMIAESVAGNDNIYTRTIASHYLHIA